ncbi:MAG: XdhC/CoxI family protein [Spirochaetaceae bacterium]|nr:MAG: XdhC/CoxI family protein [Spirochaetaceae bacterium]
MLEIRDEITRWRSEGITTVVVSLLIDMQGSGVRLPGALFAVAADGRIAGSVSGGCIEPGLIEEAESLLNQDASADTGAGAERVRIVRYDQSGGRLLSRLAPCSESVELALFRLDLEQYDQLCELLAAGREVLFTLMIDGLAAGKQSVTAVTAPPDAAVELPPYEAARAAVVSTSAGREFRYRLSPPLHLVIVGGSHIAQCLARLAVELGLAVSVVDPRPRFLGAGRFADPVRRVRSHAPGAFEELAVNAGCAVCALSHDDKIDDAGLIAALQRDAWYIGALGSPVTHAERCSRLTEAGVDREALQRIHAPVGLAIGAVTPAEIALAILTEVITEYRKRMPKRAPA